MPVFCLSVVFLDPVPAFHGRAEGGEPEWPPSPLRLFSACVAGAVARGSDLEQALDALAWLETQPAPTVVAPASRAGTPIRTAVPNNDLDVVAAAWSKGREPASQPAELKTLKTVRPTRLLDGDTVHYLWSLPDDTSEPAHAFAATLAEAARGIVALGWGIDQVAARGWILSDDQATDLPGERWLPTTGTGSTSLRVPMAGTLEALRQRHVAFLQRVSLDGDHFRPVPPLTCFGTRSYRRATDAPGWSVVAFSLLTPDAGGFRPFDAVRHTCTVAGMVRHAVALAAERSGWQRERIAMFVHGHTADGSQQARGAPDLPRFSYLPLPSVEHRPGGDTVTAIRRVLLLAPPGHDADLAWARRALSGQELIDEGTQEPAAVLSLLPLIDAQLTHYLGPRDGATRWTTVTPMILPGHDDGNPRKAERLIRKALRQSGLADVVAEQASLEWRPVGFRSGVEPARSYRVPTCHERRLRYHLRIGWWHDGRPLPVRGPLVIGAGRYTGFGLLSAERGRDLQAED